MKILGIETSCDETAASVIEIKGRFDQINVLSAIISTQIAIHQKYGGVIPEIAAREHVLNILPVINEALEAAKISPKQLDYIAVTAGPGLVTSLISGLETVRALAYAWQKPILAVNHIAGHIYANFIAPTTKPLFPILTLTVSGGHTNLVYMKKHGSFQTIGETRDDAAGEAFDKGAKMMNLGYPGGPIISQRAEAFITSGQKTDLILPRPMLNNGLDFSFSGLKTSLLYQLQKDKNWTNRVDEYCFAYQEAIIDILIKKTVAAAKKYPVKTIMLSGGVSANTRLRQRLAETIASQFPATIFLVPPLAYTTDNATMIAAAGYFINRHQPSSWQKLKVQVNFKL
jgi:N6-L-threonylcarbamoyladenine synthase